MAARFSKKPILTLLIVFIILFSGCKKLPEGTNETTDTQQVEQEPQAQQTDENVTKLVVEDNETEAATPEEIKEETYTLEHTLADLQAFLPQLDYLIGANAPASDVITVTNMKTFLISKGIDTGDAKLTSDIENYRRGSYILIGSPCDNPAAADFFKKEVAAKGNCKIFPEGEGLIKLKAVSNNNFMLYIGGNTPADTKKAAEVVKNFGNYTLTGKEVRVRGTAEAPVISIVG